MRFQLKWGQILRIAGSCLVDHQSTGWGSARCCASLHLIWSLIHCSFRVIVLFGSLFFSGHCSFRFCALQSRMLVHDGSLMDRCVNRSQADNPESFPAISTGDRCVALPLSQFVWFVPWTVMTICRPEAWSRCSQR